MKKKRKPRLKPHHELVSSKRWVVVWQGETPEDKARTRTTWQIPVGKVWDDLRQKLRDGVWPERNGLTTLDYKECMALRDLVNQYECLLSTPNWRRKEIAKALDEAIGQGEASEPSQDEVPVTLHTKGCDCDFCVEYNAALNKLPLTAGRGLSVDDLSEPLRVLDAHLAAADEASCDYCRDTGKYQIDGEDFDCECTEEP